jgi:histidyl-tRNA synthetase
VAKTIQAIRGMNDVLPAQTPAWQHLEQALHNLACQYGYGEMRFPIVEQSHLFVRTVGQESDIVQKEMYAFEDNNGDHLCLRPEGTASCVRAMIEHSQLRGQAPKVWYHGPMFRRERPQKGRYRQFHQAGFEIFNHPGDAATRELIHMGEALWKTLGIHAQLRLEINHIGDFAQRQAYQKALKTYWQTHQADLGETDRARIESNPMRILDSKDQGVQAHLPNAPKLFDYLTEESKAAFNSLTAQLTEAGIAYQHNPYLVRGLDYYNGVVFEWKTDRLGAQDTVAAGGQYDALVGILGGPETQAVGMALGLERLLALTENQTNRENTVDLYWVALDTPAQNHAFHLANALREAFPKHSIVLDLIGGKLKNQLKRANQHKARWVAMLGDDEYQAKRVTLKSMQTSDQTTLAQADLHAWCATHLNQE